MSSVTEGPMPQTRYEDSVPGVVVLDGDPVSRGALGALLSSAGIRCFATPEAPDALAYARRDRAVILAAVDALHDGPTRFLAEARAAHPPLAVVLIASDVRAATALRWIREGAADVIVRPFDGPELLASVDSAAQRSVLVRAPALPSAQAGGAFAMLVGEDPRLVSALALARAAAEVQSTVLIHGESGTGKSRLARAIHESSPRRGQPFVEVACGSMPEALLESELFGHVKGAFTGALADKRGRFLAANGGTIFLDEINSAPPAMQVKLLRVLQERRFEAVGSDETRQIDVRVVVASNEPLEQLVREGRFRQDLFYRISVLPIELPPLRERPGDVLALATHFLAEKCAAIGRTVLGFDAAARAALLAHRWPGNVRELENAVERATVLARGPWIDASVLPAPAQEASAAATRAVLPAMAAQRTAAPVEPAATLAECRRHPEREAILAALEACAWNRSRAAQRLGINRVTLYRKMRDLGLASGRDAA